MRRSAISRRGKRSVVPSSSATWATLRYRSRMGRFSFCSGGGGDGGGEPFLGGGETGTGVGPVGEDERGLVLLPLSGGFCTSPGGAGGAGPGGGGGGVSRGGRRFVGMGGSWRKTLPGRRTSSPSAGARGVCGPRRYS